MQNPKLLISQDPLEGTLATDKLNFDSQNDSQLTVGKDATWDTGSISVDTTSAAFSRTLVVWEEKNDVIALGEFRALLDFNGLAFIEPAHREERQPRLSSPQ